MGKGPLRRIGESVVAAGPAGVRVRTRLYLCGAEAEALGVIGDYLGGVYRRSWPAGSSWACWTASSTACGGRSVRRR